MIKVEAVLLTGGASRRMGTDKAKIEIGGEPSAERIARLLDAAGIRVTVCGREPIPGHAFIADREEFAGPLVALAGFEPTAELVFVASCDLVGFDAIVVSTLESRIGERDAAVPSLAGKLQPLCGLYRSTALAKAKRLSDSGERRIMRWLDELDAEVVEGIDPGLLVNANAPGDIPDTTNQRQ